MNAYTKASRRYCTILMKAVQIKPKLLAVYVDQHYFQ